MTNEIDKSLYSRQLYVIGKEAMEALSRTSVLISGMTGLGIEVAKCVILSGVKSVTIHDTGKIRKKELTSNYYTSFDDIGKNRVDVVKDKLASLNSYVNVTSNSEILSEYDFKRHQVVVICDQLPLNQINNNKISRQYGVKFIFANTMGLMGSIFCDFGESFYTSDIDGEIPRSGILMEMTDGAFISNEPHQLYFGDKIKLSINGKEYIDEVTKVKDVTTFYTKDTKLPNQNFNNCNFLQIKEPTMIKFVSLEESIKNPEFVMIIQEDFERQQLLHKFHIAVNMFVIANKRLPGSWNTNDAEEILSIVDVSDENQKKIIRKLSYTCCGKTCPMDSIFGSVVSQEVVKAASHKYNPIKQWMYIDYTSILPDEVDNDVAIASNERYSSQIDIFGNVLQKKINESKIFIVGAGAIGCELLKNLAMIGIGNITVTDMDTIEKSNLNRQFLFRYQDIGKFKSDCAKDAIIKMNSDINIVSQKNKVSDDTANIYDEKFFSQLTCVMTALDNVQARSFVDQLCVENCCPLIDSGTLGTKGNVQTIIPHLTESYRSTQDPPEKDIPMCTLKNFPYLTDHTIQWARNLFEGIFVNAPKNFLRYKLNPAQIKKMDPSELSEVYDDIMFMHENHVSHTKECIQFAYQVWHENFRDQIHHLTVKFPSDCTTAEGSQFWSGTKKFPKVLKFSENDINIEFLEATANLWADVFSLDHVTQKQILHFLKKVKPPVIKSLKGDIIIDEKQLKQKQQSNENDKSANDLPDIDDLDYTVKALEFEKDDDINFHIDFMTHASNLRATNYDIPTADKFKTKGIAGKIIPAIVTTTSLVAGLATMELLKVINGMNKWEDFTESFVNIALPFFSYSTPKKVVKNKLGQYEYSIWDTLTYDNPKLEDLIDDLNKKVNDDSNELVSVCSDKFMLYSIVSSKTAREERMKMKIADIYKKVKKIDDVKTFTISVNFDADNSDEITCKINT